MKRHILLSPDGGEGGGGESPAGITEAALKAAIEKARLEERQRLSNEINTLKASLTEASTNLGVAQTELARVTQEHAALLATVKPDAGVDVAALIKEVTDRVAVEAKKSLEGTRAELSGQVTALQQKLRQAELTALRERLIAEAGGPDKLVSLALIRGETEEDLRQSVAESAKEFARICAQIASPGDGGSGQPPLPPGGHAAGSSGADSEVRGMTTKEWAAVRDGKLAEVRKRFAGGR